MTEPRQAWAEVADHLSALALKIKLHAEEELSDEDVQQRSGLDRLGAVIQETFEGLENAADDPAVRADLQAAGSAFSDAMRSTVRTVRDELTTKK